MGSQTDWRQNRRQGLQSPYLKLYEVMNEDQNSVEKLRNVADETKISDPDQTEF